MFLSSKILNIVIRENLGFKPMVYSLGFAINVEINIEKHKGFYACLFMRQNGFSVSWIQPWT